ncbi:hypothetical protein E8D34_00965 [Nocardioides sp. GY 10113]|uniref:hypothetical protein n=1 Tax=Nocardioides sp. GY 10113 TaxID=2569761 RepID=UPI0010A8E4B6|nr:hypothetical protein [Nocardioides sp. GY 10113]TIC89107.1 hypothetical protein E8D34_00965 [Nocardioides sp. GY 10113]
MAFAGDRMWPQLDALAQWSGGLSEVHLVVAHGDEASGGPADRIAAFVADALPHVVVNRHGPIADDEPAEILAAVEKATGGHGAGWLLDASGGSRLMFAGAVRASATIPGLRVVHRDARGPWYEVHADGGARLLEGWDPAAIEQFTLADLLAVTWADEERTATVQSTTVESEITAAAATAAKGADWRHEFERAATRVRARRSIGQGSLFEQFVLALVRQLGVEADDIGISAMLHDGTQAVQEVDVVVNSHGRLHVIDCKLTDEAGSAPIGMQIRDAYATRRQLGDGADQYILLRPNRVVGEEFRSLAEEYDIRVVDQATLEERPLPDVLEQLLRPGHPGSPAPSRPLPRTLRVAQENGLVDVYAEFVQSREPVRVYDHQRYMVLQISAGRRLTSHQVTKAVSGVLRDAGTVIDTQRCSKGTRFTVVVRPGDRRHDQAAQRLATFTLDHLR